MLTELLGNRATPVKINYDGHDAVLEDFRNVVRVVTSAVLDENGTEKEGPDTFGFVAHLRQGVSELVVIVSAINDPIFVKALPRVLREEIAVQERHRHPAPIEGSHGVGVSF